MVVVEVHPNLARQRKRAHSFNDPLTLLCWWVAGGKRPSWVLISCLFFHESSQLGGLTPLPFSTSAHLVSLSCFIAYISWPNLKTNKKLRLQDSKLIHQIINQQERPFSYYLPSVPTVLSFIFYFGFIGQKRQTNTVQYTI